LEALLPYLSQPLTAIRNETTVFKLSRTASNGFDFGVYITGALGVLREKLSGEQ
jgi:hypothetical protein